MPTRQQLLEDVITALVRLMRRWPPETPGQLSITQTGEVPGFYSGDAAMADKILFDVNLPALSDPHDVASRELTWSFDRGNGPEGQPSVEAAPDQLAIVGLGAPQGSTVRLSLVDVDNASNRSEASVLEFVAADTVAPPAPGELGVSVVGEEINGFPES